MVATGKRTARAAATARLVKPQLRRNVKRIREALAQTSIHSVAPSLARARPLYVLGLDINTNSTGYAVLGGDGRVVTWGHVATSQFQSSDMLAIAHVISTEMGAVHANVVGNLPREPVEWRVGIEDFMRMYRFGKFHNKGIFQLAQLNGIVSYTCWRRFACRPVHTHPTAARALFGIVANSSAKKSEATVKEQVMELVLAREGQESDACQQLRSLHTNRLGQWTDAAYDVADAYVVAAYTRWMALQSELQQHPLLLHQFRTAYESLVLPSDSPEELPSTTTAATKKKKKKRTPVEETALRAMDDAAKRAYLSELFGVGVAEWVKQTASSGTEYEREIEQK